MSTPGYYRFQVIAIMVNTLVGVQSLYLPSAVTRVAGSAAWISVLFLSLVATAVLVLVSKAGSGLKGQSYISYLQQVLGIAAALPMLVLLLSEWVILAMQMRIFGEVVNATLLPTTPLDVVVIGMILLVAYFSGHGPKTFARVNELILIPMLVLTLGIDLLVSPHAMPARLKPLLGNGPSAILAGALCATSAFGGAGTALYFTAFVSHPRDVPITAGGVGLMTAVIYAGFVLVCLVSLGPSLTQLSSWPTLLSTTLIRLPAVFLEKVDSAFAAGWLFAVFTTSGNIMYVTTRSLGEFAGLRDSRILVVASLPWAYLLAAIPGSIEDAIRLTNIAAVNELIVAALLGVFLLSSQRARKGGTGSKKHEQKAISSMGSGTSDDSLAPDTRGRLLG